MIWLCHNGSSSSTTSINLWLSSDYIIAPCYNFAVMGVMCSMFWLVLQLWCNLSLSIHKLLPGKVYYEKKASLCFIRKEKTLDLVLNCFSKHLVWFSFGSVFHQKIIDREFTRIISYQSNNGNFQLIHQYFWIVLF